MANMGADGCKFGIQQVPEGLRQLQLQRNGPSLRVVTPELDGIFFGANQRKSLIQLAREALKILVIWQCLRCGGCKALVRQHGKKRFRACHGGHGFCLLAGQLAQLNTLPMAVESHISQTALQCKSR